MMMESKSAPELAKDLARHNITVAELPCTYLIDEDGSSVI